MSAYLATARRLMHLAAVVRGRAYHPKRYMIDTLAGALEDAAIAIQSHPVDEPGQLPQPAADALQEATELLTRHDFMIPAVIVGYATAPITGTMPQMRPLHAVSTQLAHQDADLRARRLALIEHGHLSSRDEEVLHAALTGLLVLHRRHERLAAVIAADNERPCNRGKAPASLATH
ncbi:hypothetical protein ACFOOM_01085 [Streptomyces echinoruber]|uniref:Uncharacterized protein n=1 Tax=Streptomyces echinoruber TaxID=68898 RepID=A0A918QUP4_9ACTN|nr:hypothetical protein [Streptomyces echinoruber]GGZ73089.1 hypothetical protein GCM10010389_08170 [Streptomyces echinoruber]